MSFILFMLERRKKCGAVVYDGKSLFDMCCVLGENMHAMGSERGAL